MTSGSIGSNTKSSSRTKTPTTMTTGALKVPVDLLDDGDWQWAGRESTIINGHKINNSSNNNR